MHSDDLETATRQALLAEDVTFDLNFNLRLTHVDGRSAYISLSDLLLGHFRLNSEIGDGRALYSSHDEVINAGWRVCLQRPVAPTDAPKLEYEPSPDLFTRAHLDREIPCSITLQLVNLEPADAKIVIKLLLTPMLSVDLGFCLDPKIDCLGGQFADTVVIDIARRWIVCNHDVLRAICKGEHSLARDTLDIELEDGNAWQAIVPGHTPTSEELMIAQAVASNQSNKRKASTETDPDAWRAELRRQAIIHAHRKRYALGTAMRVPGIVC